MCNFLRCIFYPDLTRTMLIFILLLSVLLPFALCHYLVYIDNSVYCEILATISGFGIASMAILCTMPQESCLPLGNDIAKHCQCMSPENCGHMSNSKMIDDLFATVTIGVIVPLFGILAYVFRGIPICLTIHTEIKMFFLLFSILWAAHITLHFFALRKIKTIDNTKEHETKTFSLTCRRRYDGVAGSFRLRF